ncbi:MAG: DNA repair protein RecO [Thermodesulfobacteriota bacterium]
MKRGHYVTEAIILESFDLGESDRIISFCTRDFGKVKGIAKGARRSRRRFVGRLEPAACIKLFFHYNGKSELVRVEDAALINGFDGLRGDMEVFAAACYLVELTGAFIRGGDSQPEIYSLLKRFLSFMESGGETELLCRFFEVKLLSLLGYMPGFEECVACGGAVSKPVTGNMFRFSANRGGLLCRSCVSAGEKAVDLSAGTAGFLQAALRMGSDKLHRLRPGPLFTREAGPLLDSFIRIRLGHGLKTKTFMEQMQSLNPAGS